MRFVSKVLPAARISLALLALGMTGVNALAQSLDAHIAPAITRFGQNLGQESPSTKLTLTVWLNLHNRAEFDARVKDLYTPGSATYHKWLKDADLKSYLPTSAEVAAVKAQLTANHLTVLSVDAFNFSVRLTGATSDIERAFHTQINRYSVKGELVRTSSSTLTLSGAAASLVHHVSGINSLPMKPMILRQMNVKTGKAFAGVPLADAKAKAKSNGVVFASECFYAPTSVSLSGVDAQGAGFPVSATFAGLTYGANPNNTLQGTLSPCGYSPSEVQKFYGLDVAYGLGYTGAGETIVVVDSYLEPTAKPDLIAFSNLNNLPAITSANYTEYNPYGANQPGADYGVDEETDLDLQWSHATAPGANLALVQSFSEDEEDQQAAILWAITQHLGNVISFSYGYPESFTGPFALDVFSEIAQFAAAEGVALNVSSGDEGDDTPNGNGIDVDAPADSPYATAVGGTSIGTSPIDGSLVTVGWGNNVGILSADAADIYDPPYTLFNGGSGGGASAYFAKPAYQSSLPGPARLLPDVSALADPFTGAEFVYTNLFDGNQYVGVVGGTSLASPIFSGIWTLVDQYYGVPLGQAAPYIAAYAQSAFIQDIQPVGSPYNVTGSITDPYSGTTTYGPSDLSQPLGTTTQFVSALWNEGDSSYINLSFGTDSSLNVTQGWDNVTGWGTPNVGAALTAIGATANPNQQ